MQLSVEKVQLYLHDQGHGQPTLFLHGNPDSADMWRAIINQLAPLCRCLAIDLPGFGRSRAPATFDCSLEHLATFIDKTLVAIGVTEPINLVVHDFGAHYGLAWAVMHPHKVQSMVIFNTNFFSDYRWHGLAQLLRTPLMGELLMAATTEKTLIQSLQHAAPKLTAEQIRHTARLYTPAAKRMALRLYRTRNGADFRGWEDKLVALTTRVPIYVMWGDHDPSIAPAYAARFGAARVEHFADHSHWLPLEAADMVAARLRAFFSAHTPHTASAHGGDTPVASDHAAA